jgi:peroxiredoxin
LRGRYEEVTSKGAELVAIGMGWPAAAADFREHERIPFPLIVDHTKKTYRALDMKRGGRIDIVGPSVLWRGAKSFLGGNKQSRPKQDPVQLGGAVVVDADGEVLYVHRSENSSDNVPAEELIAALP